ncbi:sulfurtransferase TusA family protein [Candidatus Methylacidithermus pantelleriae]|uniref:sulfurtransferase TusA family protein n=1 Tax=Candidatus Methylacidithermus pantelleriae TaxID=2744239 RepID=UPI0038B26388
MEAMQPGEVLELLSSDPISWWELPAWLNKKGHRLLSCEKGGRLWWRWYRFLIEKGGQHGVQLD